MILKDYQVYIHGAKPDVHIDVTLTFDGLPKIKLCDCQTYMGGVDSYSDPSVMLGRLRRDLDALRTDAEYDVFRDESDGSLDIIRQSDNALVFSMVCKDLTCRDIPTYDSAVGV